MGREGRETAVFCYEPIAKLFAPFSLDFCFFFNNIVSLVKAATLDFTYFLLYFYFEKVTSAYLSFLFGFWNRISCSPGWFYTCSVAEDDLDFPLLPKWCLHARPLFMLCLLCSFLSLS